MNKLILSTLTLAGLVAASGAQAQAHAPSQEKFYAGAGISTSGELTLRRNGVTEKSDHKNALRVFGGYQLDEHFSVEAGYLNFGHFKYASGPSVKLQAAYLAGKASMPIGEQFSVYGKLGVAYHGQKFSDINDTDASYHKSRPMFGVGTAWHMTEKVALSLELNNYGTVKTDPGKIKMRALEAGLNFKF